MSCNDTETTTRIAAATENLANLEKSLVRHRLWGALTDRDEHAAAATVFGALDAGMTPEEVLLDVIAPVQHRVGSEWAANRITVAQEHAATTINDRVVAALAHHDTAAPAPHAGRVTVACVDGEWHALPARLLAEVLRLRGWQVDFLGAQVPTEDIAHIVDFLAIGLYNDDDLLFTNFITWKADILTARGMPAASLRPALELLDGQLNDFPRARRLLHAAKRALDAESPGAPE